MAAISAARAGADLDDRALRRLGGIGRQQRRVDRTGAGEEAQLVRVVEADHPFAPAGAGADELADRHGVEQFVADDQQRRLRQRGDGFVPADRSRTPGKRLLLDFGQARAGLDQREGRAGGQRRIEPRQRAQHVLHQRAAAGADLGDGDRQRPADRLPGLIQPDARSVRRTSG